MTDDNIRRVKNSSVARRSRPHRVVIIFNKTVRLFGREVEFCFVVGEEHRPVDKADRDTGADSGSGTAGGYPLPARSVNK